MELEEKWNMMTQLMETFQKLYGEGGEIRTYFAPEESI